MSVINDLKKNYLRKYDVAKYENMPKLPVIKTKKKKKFDMGDSFQETPIVQNLKSPLLSENTPLVMNVKSPLLIPPSPKMMSPLSPKLRQYGNTNIDNKVIKIGENQYKIGNPIDVN